VGKAEAAEAWEKLSEAVKAEMPAAIAYGYALFFSALLPKLLEGSLIYFQNQAKKLSKQAKRAAGSKSFSTSQTKTRRK
jgi:polyhydroxyalkanoate synthesis regulator protein